MLTRYLREQLESLVPQSLVRVAAYLKSRRPRLKAAIPDIRTRRITTEAFFAGPGFSHAEAGEDDLADGYLFSATEGAGEVFLVGAGPGDPDLLTLKALQLLQRADVILYDNLVSAKVLDRARRDATFEYVGKQSGLNSTPQTSINARLVNLARQGLRVVRLKGGDPFIFGRGGEELAEHHGPVGLHGDTGTLDEGVHLLGGHLLAIVGEDESSVGAGEVSGHFFCARGWGWLWRGGRGERRGV